MIAKGQMQVSYRLKAEVG